MDSSDKRAPRKRFSVYKCMEIHMVSVREDHQEFRE